MAKSDWNEWKRAAEIVALVVSIFLGAWAFGPIFGLSAGGLIFLAFLGDRLIEFRFGNIQARLKEIETVRSLSEDARKLAQLSVEMAFYVGNLPRGFYDQTMPGLKGSGPTTKSLDEMRCQVVRRLGELGVDRQQAAEFASFDDQPMEYRFFIIIQRRLIALLGSKSEISERLGDLSKGSALLPSAEDIVAILPKGILEDFYITEIIKVYRSWYSSDVKLFYIVENIEEIQNLENKSEAWIK